MFDEAFKNDILRESGKKNMCCVGINMFKNHVFDHECWCCTSRRTFIITSSYRRTVWLSKISLIICSQLAHVTCREQLNAMSKYVTCLRCLLLSTSDVCLDAALSASKWWYACHEKPSHPASLHGCEPKRPAASRSIGRNITTPLRTHYCVFLLSEHVFAFTVSLFLSHFSTTLNQPPTLMSGTSRHASTPRSSTAVYALDIGLSMFPRKLLRVPFLPFNFFFLTVHVFTSLFIVSLQTAFTTTRSSPLSSRFQATSSLRLHALPATSCCQLFCTVLHTQRWLQPDASAHGCSPALHKCTNPHNYERHFAVLLHIALVLSVQSHASSRILPPLPFPESSSWLPRSSDPFTLQLRFRGISALSASSR